MSSIIQALQPLYLYCYRCGGKLDILAEISPPATEVKGSRFLKLYPSPTAELWCDTCDFRLWDREAIQEARVAYHEVQRAQGGEENDNLVHV